MTGDQSNNSSIAISGGATILDPVLATLNRVDLEVDNTGDTISTAQIASVNGDNIYATAGAALSLPGVTSLAGTTYGVTIEPTGTSGTGGTGTPSTISFPNLTTLTGGTNNNVLYLYAESGADLNLSDVTTIPSGRIFFQSSGSGSVLDLSKLTSITDDQSNNSSIDVNGGATILDPVLATLNRTDLGVDNTGDTISTTQITSVNGDNIYTNSGGVLSLPGVTSLAGANYGVTIEPSGTSGTGGTGTPSTISFPNLTTLSGGINNNVLYLYAASGADLNLSDVTTIPSGRIFFRSSGTGTVLDLTKLTSITDDQSNNSSIDVNGGATILDPALATLNRTDLGVDNTGDTISTAQITSVNGDNLYATAGGVLSLPGVTSLAGVNYGVTIEPSGTSGTGGTGTPSSISFPNLTTLTGGINNNVLYLYAESGGDLSLPDVASIPSGRIFFYSSGAGSVLDLSKLTSITSDQSNNSSLNVTSGGALLDPVLTTLNRVDTTIDGTATIGIAQITSYIGATLTANSGSFAFSGLTTINGDDVYAYGGADVAFPNVASLAGASTYYTTVEASGTNGASTPSTIDLSHVTTLSGGTNDDVLFLYAESGGKLSLPNVPSDTTGRTYFESNGAGSLLDLSKLASFGSNQSSPSSLVAISGGTVLDPLLTSINFSYLTTDGTATIATAQLTSVTDSTIQANSGTPNYTGLSTISGDDVYAYGGADVAFPNVTSLAGASTYYTTVEASGTNGASTPSTVDLSHVTTLSGGTNDDVLFLYAESGGKLSLPNVPSDTTGRTYFESNGTGSVLDLSKLASFGSDQGNASSLVATSGGTVLDPLLTSINFSYLTTDGTATIATAQLTSVTDSTIQANSGTPNYTGLTSISGDDVYAYGGADIALPNVTSLAGASTYYTTVEASGTSGPNGTGTPSTIDLSHVTTLSGGTNDDVLFLYAESGGKLSLPNATSDPSGRIYFESNGAGSVLDLTDLTSIIDDQGNSSSLNVTSGGTVIDPNLTTFSYLTITTDPTATFTVPSNQTFSFPTSTTTISTGTVLDQGGLALGRNETLHAGELHRRRAQGSFRPPGRPIRARSTFQ